VYKHKQAKHSIAARATQFDLVNLSNIFASQPDSRITAAAVDE
jgi:hypothetical protein